ncbi:MAG: alanine racemase [Actinobacteria bacterium]|nr:alanine racemase [Actinomycetota bacterium]
MHQREVGENLIKKCYAWVEIDLRNLSHNLHLVRSHLSSPNTYIMAVVKANAYGHGAVEVSRKAIESGAHCLGVAMVSEGVKLRKAGINAPIYILGEVPSDLLIDALENNLILSVNSYESACEISSKSLNMGRKAIVHINVDTGMNRIGINFKEAVSQIARISSLPGVKVEGLFTHFSCASSRSYSYTFLQWNRFKEIIDQVRKMGLNISLFHCANSAAFLRYKEMHLDMVRIGVAMYGLNPFDNEGGNWLEPDVRKVVSDLKPVLSLKARVSFIKRIEKGEQISYCGTFKTKRKSIIATLPIGYADGYPRILSNRSKVLIGGGFAPVVGNITMDQLMIDVTDVPYSKDVKVGSEAILIGSLDGLKITSEELARLAGTINYEIVCMLKERLPRVYIS